MRPTSPPAKPLVGKESKVQRVARVGAKQGQKPNPACPVAGHGPMSRVKYAPHLGPARLVWKCYECMSAEDTT